MEKECCPKVDPKIWDNKVFTWNDKKFIKDNVRQFMHIPLGMGKVITRMWKKLEAADAIPKEFLLLSYDPSPWKSELYMAAEKDAPGAENITISGDFCTKVYDGPFENCGKFYQDMQQSVKNQGKEAKKIYFYFTTCPKCAKKYGHNYIVAFAQI
jgi:hypothetical protein